MINGKMAVASDADSSAETAADGSTDLAPVEAKSTESHPIDAMENIFYKSVDRNGTEGGRREGVSQENRGDSPALPAPGQEASIPNTAPNEAKEPRFPFRSMAQLLAISRKHNLTIAQIVYENELTWYTPEEIDAKVRYVLT